MYVLLSQIRQETLFDGSKKQTATLYGWGKTPEAAYEMAEKETFHSIHPVTLGKDVPQLWEVVNSWFVDWQAVDRDELFLESVKTLGGAGIVLNFRPYKDEDVA